MFISFTRVDCMDDHRRRLYSNGQEMGSSAADRTAYNNWSFINSLRRKVNDPGWTCRDDSHSIRCRR